MTVIIGASIAAAYLVGSLPNGYWVIRLLTGQDLTQLGSGRTGGTNAMRAGGSGAGLLTGALDVFKGAAAVWLTRWMLSGQVVHVSTLPWVEAAGAVAVVVGHNWSLFLHFRGGAGTGPNVGAAIALCPYAGMILPPFVLLAIFLTGYASVASLLTALLIPSLLYLASRLTGLPLEFAGYGAATCLVIMWALRPNIVRLCAGQERRVSLKWDGERSLRERGD